MSLVAIALNVLLAGLLLAALVMGWRLGRQLKALRTGHTGFVKAVAELDEAALRAERGLTELRGATEQAGAELAERIERARALAQQIDQRMERVGKIAERAAPKTPAQSARDLEAVAAEAEDDDWLLNDLRRGEARQVGRERRPVAARISPAREVAPVRSKARIDDDLFEQAVEARRAQPLGGRR